MYDVLLCHSLFLQHLVSPLQFFHSALHLLLRTLVHRNLQSLLLLENEGGRGEGGGRGGGEGEGGGGRGEVKGEGEERDQ